MKQCPSDANKTQVALQLCVAQKDPDVVTVGISWSNGASRVHTFTLSPVKCITLLVLTKVNLCSVVSFQHHR